jgi:hypothetical protein
MHGLAQARLGRIEAGRQSFLHGLKRAYDTDRRLQCPRAIYGFAEIARASGSQADAVKLAGLIHKHDVTPHEVKLYANDLLKALEADLPPDKYAVAYTQGKSLDLDTAVRQLLDEDLDI